MAKKRTETEISTKKNIFDTIPPKAAFIFGAILILLGIVFTCISLAPRKTAIDALENFTSKSVVCENGVLNSDYTGSPVIVSGTLEYSEDGAIDAVLGVSADSPILYRVSEMYQWTVSDGKVTAVWSEEIIESPDAGHTNPSAYPSNMKSNYYIAESVRIGDFSISADLLLQFENKITLASLPEIDTRGFYNVSEYITNSSDIENPEIGDVRIHYEYVDIDEATFAGKQRSSSIYSYSNYNDVPFFLALEGIQSKSEVISEFHSRSEHSIIWLLILSSAATLFGSFVLFCSFCYLTGYKPSLAKVDKKLVSVSPEKVTLIHSILFALLLYALVCSVVWASVYAICLAFTAILIILHLSVLIPDMIKNMPRQKKDEAEYVPILIKRDEEIAKKNRR